MNAPDPSRTTAPPASARPASEPRLPRSIFIPREDPRKEIREGVDAILTDAFMGFVSLLLIPIILLPLLWTLPAQVLDLLAVSDAIIVVIFIVEYLSKLALAERSWEHFRNPWHLLDLAVIVISVVTYLPFLALGGRGSSLLLIRLVRLTRVLAVSGRTASSRIRAHEAGPASAPAGPSLVIREVDPTGTHGPAVLSWAELERRLAAPDEAWIDLGNVSEADAMKLAGLLHLREQHFRLRQLDDLPPHLGEIERTFLMYVQSRRIRFPERPEELFRIPRRGLVVVSSGAKVLTVSPHGTDLVERVREVMGPSGSGARFLPSVLHAIMEVLLEEYRSIFSDIEGEVLQISYTPRSKLPSDFLPRMYQLSKATQRLSTNLDHFRELLGRVATKKLPLAGFDESVWSRFQGLADECAYLAQVADDIADGLRTSIDVYINQSSFETNRILKILAVITALAIIPSTIGGLLGIDGPYVFVLWQVLFLIAVSMTFAAYCFIKLGWLRT